MKELDNKLSEDDLDGIVDEIDEDGSGTVDFDGKYFFNIFYEVVTFAVSN